MDKEIAQKIADYSDMELMEEYSGRGMYGNTTAAVTGSFSDLMGAVATLYRDLIDEMNRDSMTDEQIDSIYDKADELEKAIVNIRSDSMGMSYVFY